MARDFPALKRVGKIFTLCGGSGQRGRYGRLRLVGLRRRVAIPMASVAMVRSVGSVHDCRKRASLCGAGGGTVGCGVVGRSRVAALGQHNSGVCRGHGVVAGFLGHAPATDLSILRRALRFFVAGATPPGDLQYAG